jgi:hypothetical protein
LHAASVEIDDHYKLAMAQLEEVAFAKLTAVKIALVEPLTKEGQYADGTRSSAPASATDSAVCPPKSGMPSVVARNLWSLARRRA